MRQELSKDCQMHNITSKAFVKAPAVQSGEGEDLRLGGIYLSKALTLKMRPDKK